MSQTEKTNNVPVQSVPVASQPATSRAQSIYAACPDNITPDVLSKRMGGKPTGVQIRRLLRDIFDTEGQRQTWIFSKANPKQAEFVRDLLIPRLLMGGSRAATVNDDMLAKASSTIRKAGNSGR